MQKLDGVSEIEFLEEAIIFNKSFSFTNSDFDALKDEIKDKLSNIGELGEIISKNELFEVSKVNNVMKDILSEIDFKKKLAKKK